MSRFNLSKSDTAVRSFVLQAGRHLVVNIDRNRNYIAFLSPHGNEFAKGIMWKGQRITSLCAKLVERANIFVSDFLLHRTLSNGDVLAIWRTINENGIQCYEARCSSDIGCDGFEGDNGIIKEGETLSIIANQIEMWMEDNLNDALMHREKHGLTD
jgi:hypothetical protein